jgi:hypothetical protein
MSNASNQEIEQAVREYLEAIDKLKELRDKYLPAGQLTPGEPVNSEEMMSEEALAEFKEAAAKVAEKWEKCLKLRWRRQLPDVEG